MADANSEDSGASNNEPTANTTQGNALTRLINHMQLNKIEAALWLTRIFTVVSSIVFILPIFGGNPASMYQRALLSNAATSALRLHQRLPNFQLNKEFFGLMFLEDSAHYLFYSLIFVMSQPVSIAVVPVFLFALLHATNYTKALLNQIGPASLSPIRNLITKVEQQQRQILRFIAATEVFIMPMLIVTLFTGGASLLQPFIYYRFLTLRYSSRRNPYCRQIIYELRITTEHLISKPQCPSFLRNAAYKAIAFATRMAPVLPTQ